MEEMQMDPMQMETKLNELSDRITKLEEALGLATQQVQQAQAIISTQNDLNKKLFSLIEKVADAPSVEPKSTSKENFKKSNPMSSLEEFRKLAFK